MLVKSVVSMVFLMAMAALLTVPAPAMAASKMAVVNVESAVRDCKAGKKAIATLEGKKKEIEAEFNQMRKKIESLREELEKTAMVLKQEAKLAKQMELQRLARKFQERQRDARREFQEAEQLHMSPILRRMVQLIRQIGQDSGYDIIQDARTTVYFKTSADITAKVVAAYDKKYPK